MLDGIRKKIVVGLLLASFGFTSMHCGLILHPDRNGRRGGRVDVVAIVLDCLWLFVGVVPGIVALVIDFVTGGIYEGAIKHLFPGDMIGLRFNGPAPADADVAITLTAPDGEVHTLARRHVDKGQRIDEGPVSVPETMIPGKYSLGISVNGRENARFPVQIQ
jgi:hypothetical protein